MRKAIWAAGLVAACAQTESMPLSPPQSINDCYSARPYSPMSGPILQAYNDAFVQGCLAEFAARDTSITMTRCTGSGDTLMCVTQ